MNQPNEQPLANNEETSAGGWSSTRRFWVSVVLVLHVLAIFIAPLAAVEPRSQLSLNLRRLFEPYLQFMYLDHGYRFFAPQPGPSHIVRFELTDETGETTKHHFPDRDKIWPRLRYHRWFMLSESINQFTTEIPDEDAKKRWTSEVDEQIKSFEAEGNLRRANQVRRDYEQQLEQNRRIVFMLEHLSQDLGRVLLEKHQAKTVNMTLITRLIPTPYDVLDGYQLIDEVFVPKELQTDLGVVGQGREALPDGEVDSN